MKDRKKRFRDEYFKKIESLSDDYVREGDLSIYNYVISLPEFQAAKSIFAYYSLGKEPDTRAIIEYALELGKTVSLPICHARGIMHAHIIRSTSELVDGKFNIPAPPEDSEIIVPEDLDLILVPAVTFDKAGFRMGKGGGYYDRYLAKTSAFTVGLARGQLIADEVPCEATDMSVDCIVTEKGIARLS